MQWPRKHWGSLTLGAGMHPAKHRRRDWWASCLCPLDGTFLRACACVPQLKALVWARGCPILCYATARSRHSSLPLRVSQARNRSKCVVRRPPLRQLVSPRRQWLCCRADPPLSLPKSNLFPLLCALRRQLLSNQFCFFLPLLALRVDEALQTDDGLRVLWYYVQ